MDAEATAACGRVGKTEGKGAAAAAEEEAQPGPVSSELVPAAAFAAAVISSNFESFPSRRR